MGNDLKRVFRGSAAPTSRINPVNLRDSWCLEINIQYEWRWPTICTSNATFADETRGRDIAPEVLRAKVTKLLGGKTFRTKPPQHPRQYVKWMLKRIDLLTKTGGPRMRVVWWKTLVDLGRIPRWPQDKHHILDLRSLLKEWLKYCDNQGRVDGRYLYIWMLSHRWERPHFCEDCASGDCPLMYDAHPDSVTNIKARTVGKWGEHQYDEGNVGPLSPEDHYIWIDFTSIDQDDSVQKLLGIEMLPLYVACCGSGLVMYLPNDPEIGYEERAWTAIERILGYVYGTSGVLKKIDSGYIKGAPRWTQAALIKEKPQFWEEKHGKLCFRLTDPLSGRLTCEEDSEKITRLKEIIEITPPIDFYGMKEAFFWNETLCRVDDTCRERSTVMHRDFRRQGTQASMKAENSDRSDLSKGGGGVKRVLSKIGASVRAMSVIRSEGLTGLGRLSRAGTNNLSRSASKSFGSSASSGSRSGQSERERGIGALCRRLCCCCRNRRDSGVNSPGIRASTGGKLRASRNPRISIDSDQSGCRSSGFDSVIYPKVSAKNSGRPDGSTRPSARMSEVTPLRKTLSQESDKFSSLPLGQGGPTRPSVLEPMGKKRSSLAVPMSGRLSLQVPQGEMMDKKMSNQSRMGKQISNQSCDSSFYSGSIRRQVTISDMAVTPQTSFNSYVTVHHDDEDDTEGKLKKRPDEHGLGRRTSSTRLKDVDVEELERLASTAIAPIDTGDASSFRPNANEQNMSHRPSLNVNGIQVNGTPPLAVDKKSSGVRFAVDMQVEKTTSDRPRKKGAKPGSVIDWGDDSDEDKSEKVRCLT